MEIVEDMFIFGLRRLYVYVCVCVYYVGVEKKLNWNLKCEYKLIKWNIGKEIVYLIFT